MASVCPTQPATKQQTRPETPVDPGVPPQIRSVVDADRSRPWPVSRVLHPSTSGWAYIRTRSLVGILPTDQQVPDVERAAREARRLRAAELLRAGQSHQNDQVVWPRICSAYSARVPTP